MLPVLIITALLELSLWAGAHFLKALARPSRRTIRLQQMQGL